MLLIGSVVVIVFGLVVSRGAPDRTVGVRALGAFLLIAAITARASMLGVVVDDEGIVFRRFRCRPPERQEARDAWTRLRLVRLRRPVAYVGRRACCARSRARTTAAECSATDRRRAPPPVAPTYVPFRVSAPSTRPDQSALALPARARTRCAPTRAQGHLRDRRAIGSRRGSVRTHRRTPARRRWPGEIVPPCCGGDGCAARDGRRRRGAVDGGRCHPGDRY